MRGLRLVPLIVMWLACTALTSWGPPVRSPLAGDEPDPRLEALLTSIKERERSLKTFTARFFQTRKTRVLKEPLLSEGLVYFDAEGKMLLEVTRPAPFKVLFKDNFLTLYDPESRAVQERYLGPGDFFKRVFGLGGTVDDLRGQYTITLVSETPPEGYHLRLVPRQGRLAGRIAAIETAVRSKDWVPVWVSVRESEGDQTDIRIEYTSFNEPLPQGIFDLPVPAGDEREIR